MKQKDLANTTKNTQILFDSPEKFVGMRIIKSEVDSECIGYEHYTKETEQQKWIQETSWLLVWKQTCKRTGVIKIRKTSFNFRIGDVPSRFKDAT